MFKEVTAFVDRHQKFVVTTHVNPDCDAIGSAIGLALMLEARGKQVRIINNDPTPARFSFVDPEGRIETFSDSIYPHADEAVAVVDVGDLKRLGKLGLFLTDNPRPSVCIDHHRSNTGFAEVNLILPDACATGLILANLAKAWGISFTESMASALYVAIYTDTGGFRYPSTDADTLLTAAELVAAGADPSYLATEFHENVPLGRVRLFSKVLDSLQVEAGGQVAWVKVSLAEMDAYGCDRADVEGFVEYLRGIESIEVAILFRESEPGKTKMSFRSKSYVDCSAIASRFGGGGHYHAAGSDIAAPLDLAPGIVMPMIQAAIKEGVGVTS